MNYQDWIERDVKIILANKTNTDADIENLIVFLICKATEYISDCIFIIQNTRNLHAIDEFPNTGLGKVSSAEDAIERIAFHAYIADLKERLNFYAALDEAVLEG